MTLKIICECGSKYAFDVDPTAQTMPFEVVCPTCGLNGTPRANELLAEKGTGPELPAAGKDYKSKVRLKVDTGPAPVLNVESKERVEGASYELENCARHTNEPASDRCTVCQKPICPLCKEQFGFLCSIRCKYDAEKAGIKVPVCRDQRLEAAKREHTSAMLWMWIAFLFVLLSFVGYLAYYFHFSRPAVVFEAEPGKQRSEYSRLLSETELLIVQSKRASLYDPQTTKAKWVAPLKETLGSEFEYDTPGISITENAIFIANNAGLFQLDRKTGAKQILKPFDANPLSIEARGAFISVVLGNGKSGRQILTLNVEDKKLISYTEQVKTVNPVVIDARGRPKLPPTSSNLLNQELSGEVENDPVTAKLKTEFVASPRGPIRMEVDLQELKGEFVATVKESGGKLNANTSASSNVRSILNDINNDATRQSGKGSKWINQSSYKVRFTQPNNTGAGWRGDVTGDVSFFPLQTVSVLFSGPHLTVLDGTAASKLFESKLNYEIDDRFKNRSWGVREDFPAVEHEGKLYTFDAGVLTCFELPTGNVSWRLTSVGIKKLTFDDKGYIYVSTTGRTPESIQYSEQSRVGDRDQEVVLKVEAKSGVVKWKIENQGSDCHLSGKYLYTTSVVWGGFKLDPEAHFRVFRIDPANGKRLWEYYHKGEANGVSAQNRTLSLDYGDKVEVIKFFSF